ncbi:MAG TPA: glycogen synthase GlgA [Thermoanaerobaculia bacterium]
MQIIFASAEVSPFAKTGGLGDVCGALPKALAKLGHDVAVFMPYYRQAREWFERRGERPETIADISIGWAGWSAPMTLLRTRLPDSEVPVYLIANDYFFDRGGIYEGTLDFQDDQVERFTFFCRAIISACGHLGLHVDLVHAHDWHTALLPLYLHSGLRGDSSFRDAASVYTIHNLNYQGRYGFGHFRALGLHSFYSSEHALEYFGDINLMKAGIIFSDQVTTVSPTYAREIQTVEFGAGLDGILRANAHKLSGILNGIDVDEWNPEQDPLITSPFSVVDMKGKVQCKKALRKEAELDVRSKAPIVSLISRFSPQKGLEILLGATPDLLRAGAQIVVLGTGEGHYEDAFRTAEAAYPRQFRAWIKFDTPLAHRVIAGSDLLLMPSLYEPCGLNQMYALRYGTLPVVRLTGGLADTVIPYDGSNLDSATGFGFHSTDPRDLYLTTWVGMTQMRDTAIWRTLQENGMSADFSWEHSAREYERVYRRARAG